jgi:hypothetical protein
MDAPVLIWADVTIDVAIRPPRRQKIAVKIKGFIVTVF